MNHASSSSKSYIWHKYARMDLVKIFKRLPSINFTWFTLEYFVPFADGECIYACLKLYSCLYFILFCTQGIQLVIEKIESCLWTETKRIGCGDKHLSFE